MKVWTVEMVVDDKYEILVGVFSTEERAWNYDRAQPHPDDHMVYEKEVDYLGK